MPAEALAYEGRGRRKSGKRLGFPQLSLWSFSILCGNLMEISSSTSTPAYAEAALAGSSSTAWAARKTWQTSRPGSFLRLQRGGTPRLLLGEVEQDDNKT
ncbi:MAG: hypothetical protein LC725_01135 [Lentisphaerae bacterium]|nr:hypothetical protein [Lentisphaerota bacterium]